jgi:hypothetical protein
MRERLLGSTGADLSRVYVCEDGGSIVGAAASAVFHWDDLTGREADVIETEGGWRAGDVARAAGVSVADLVAAWQFVQRLSAGVGLSVGAPVPSVCPVCAGDDVVGDGLEFGDGDTVSQWIDCTDCGSSWEDIYALVARGNVRTGSRVDIATARQSVPVVGPADHLDMAYEDRTDLGDEGRIYSGGWES